MVNFMNQDMRTSEQAELVTELLGRRWQFRTKPAGAGVGLSLRSARLIWKVSSRPPQTNHPTHHAPFPPFPHRPTPTYPCSHSK